MTADPATAPITAIVVCLNEAALLDACLASLSWCDQLIVVDLESTDDSAAVAERNGALVLRHPRVPLASMAWPAALRETRHHWVLRADPDEVMPRGLARRIVSETPELPSDVATVRLPHQYYFRGRPLLTTPWGGTNYTTKMFHIHRTETGPWVHAELGPAAGYRETSIETAPEDAIRHAWVASYRQFFFKHRRYLGLEGQSRFARGERFEWRTAVRDTLGTLRYALFTKQGVRGGIDGVTLSLLYTGYVGLAHIQLRRYEAAVAAGRVSSPTSRAPTVDPESPDC